MRKPNEIKKNLNKLNRKKFKKVTIYSLLLLIFMAVAQPVCLASHNDECIEYTIDVDAELDTMPKIGESAASFVPKGWTMESSVKGDLNNDGVNDLGVVIVRREGQGCFGEDIARVVVVAFHEKDKGYKRVAVSNGVARLECSMMSDVSLKIERGGLLVSNLSGSRDLLVEQCRFRYNIDLQKFQLIGKDRYQCDRLTMEGREDSTNLITGDRIVENIKSGDVVTTKRLKVKKQPLKVFENVSVASLFNPSN